ncbi:DUF4296 domain-containing protein [Marinifilum sp.]|uniref:DUF4296 domain-containing protein n=1 Tax=Marinifilum sp. TaxID=2033137 RepID=UPI003BA9D3C1
MNKVLIIAIAAVLAFLFSCSKEKKGEPKLNQEEFIHMLIDIHIADGTMSAQNIYRAGKNYRPSYYYNSIYEKYGIQPDEFDSCVAYYADNTSNFTKIYDKVIDSLNRLETKYRIDIKNAKLEQDTINLWQRKDNYSISNNRKLNFQFRIPIKERGIYTISADIRIFSKDQTLNPKMEAYFWKSDTINGPQEIHFDPKMIEKDSIFKTYSIQLEYPDTIYTELRGNLFSWENDLKIFTQKYDIKNIKIYNPEMKPDTAAIENEIEKHLSRDRMLHDYDAR